MSEREPGDYHDRADWKTLHGLYWTAVEAENETVSPDEQAEKRVNLDKLPPAKTQS